MIRPGSSLAFSLSVVLVLSILTIAPAFAVDGRVVWKESGGPVADAEVAILGRSGSARTDGDGRFQWPHEPRPPFEVLVVLPGGGYAKPISVLDMEATALLAITPALEESVTVVAGSAPSIESAPANGVTVVPVADLRGRQPANLAQALENVAGTAAVSEGHAAVPAVRGLAGGRTLILVDGARVTSERRVGASATYLDPASVEGIEISRGPGSVAYGSDAFGGVVHVRSRRATPGAPLGGRLTGSVGVGAPQQRAALELSRGFARGGILLQGHWRNFDDWTSPEGKVPNSGARDQGALLRFDHQWGGGLLSAGWQSDFGRNIERPRTNSQSIRFYYPTEDSHRFTLGWESAAVAGFRRLGATAFLGSHAVVTDQDRLATPTRPRSIERADVLARDFHVRTFAEKGVGRLKLEGGVDVNGRLGLEAHDITVAYDTAGVVLRTTDTVSVEDARRVDAGLYLQVEGEARDSFLVAAGARLDRVTTRNEGGFFGPRNESNTALSGFASLTAGPFEGFSATAQVARGFRDPTLSDRYFRGPSGRGFITGNPDLQPEASTQMDGALRYGGAGWRVALYGYHYRIRDLVERYQTDPDFFFFRNRGRVRLRGVEAEMQASLPARLSLEFTAHRLSGRALDDGTALDSIPVPTLTARLRRDFSRGYVWVRTGVYGPLDEPGPTEEQREGHGVLDAGLGVQVKHLELDLLFRNVLDESYLVSPDARAVLAAGRSAIATATLRF